MKVKFHPVGDSDRYVTVGRTRRDLRFRPVTTARVRFELKIVIRRDRRYRSDLWWTRCDLCQLMHREGSHELSETHADAVAAAVRHARDAHDVQL